MSEWLFTYSDYVPEREGHREALCTVGNGYFATRGAQPESVEDGIHYPGTYIAGIFNRLATDVAGEHIENESMVNVPNWLPLTFRIEDGPWFDIDKVEILDYAQHFDMLQGVMVRRVRFRDQEGRTTRVAQRRFAHMRQPHVAALETTIRAEDWSGTVTVRSTLDGRVENCGVERYRDLASKHLEPVEGGPAEEDVVWLVMRTNQSRHLIAEAARTRVFDEDSEITLERRAIAEPELVGHEFEAEMKQGRLLVIEKTAAIYTSRDRAISEPGLEARKAVNRAGTFADLLQDHVLAWDHLMRRFRLHIDVTEPERRMVNMHVAHLLEVVSENTIGLDAGVPARGLNGEAYRGHIFWDELFIFPYLNFRLPDLTRSLLLYRHSRLPEAKWAAEQAGYKGAMFPWQSGSDGREENQRLHLNPVSGRWLPDLTHLQRHISAAVAYNVWQYFEVTNDVQFLASFGGELLVEISRFWASLASYNEQLGRYEICGVMGPDEYHDAYPGKTEPGLHNNAYTNVMVAWTLCRTLDMLERVPKPQRRILEERMSVTEEELALWEAISSKMRVVFHEDGIISQFEGYENLREFDWEGYAEKYGDIQRLDRILEAEGDSPNNYKLSKQADVLMLFYLFSAEELCSLFTRLGYDLPAEDIPRNIEYYLKRTSHGSTLSRVVQAWTLARTDRTGSWEGFLHSLQSDIAQNPGNTTREGIHLGAMAGTVDILQRGYTGLEPRGDVLWIDPALPDGLNRLRLRIRYRGQWMDLDIDHDRLVVKALGAAWSDTVQVGIDGAIVSIAPGQSAEVPVKR